MFYHWFLWQFDIMDLDISSGISDWKISEVTKELFIEVYANILREVKIKIREETKS